MQNDWIETKRAANLETHGIDFADLVPVFEARMLVSVDRRRDYVEERKVGIGMLNRRVIVIVWAEHRGIRFIISARRANEKERTAYEASGR